MAIPIIYPTISVLCYKQGQYFEFQPAASESPTTWAAVGLPSGITINSVTGLIAGESMGIGVYDITLTATNVSGTSEEFFFPIVLLESNSSMDEAIELDVDLSTGEVTRLDQQTDQPILFAKSGDRILISIGFKKGNEYQTVLMRDVTIALKEFETESVVVLSDGIFALSRSGFRYLIIAHFEKTKLRSSLSNYEADKGTYYHGLGELRWSWDRNHFLPGDVVTLERASQTFSAKIERNLVS